MSEENIAYIHLTVLVNSENVDQTREELHTRLLWHPTTVEVKTTMVPAGSETVEKVEKGTYRTMQELLDTHKLSVKNNTEAQTKQNKDQEG